MNCVVHVGEGVASGQLDVEEVVVVVVVAVVVVVVVVGEGMRRLRMTAAPERFKGRGRSRHLRASVDGWQPLGKTRKKSSVDDDDDSSSARSSWA